MVLSQVIAEAMEKALLFQSSVENFGPAKIVHHAGSVAGLNHVGSKYLADRFLDGSAPGLNNRPTIQGNCHRQQCYQKSTDR